MVRSIIIAGSSYVFVVDDTIFFYPESISDMDRNSLIEVLYINNHQIQISSQSSKNLAASIIDISGKMVMNNILILANQNTTIDLSAMQNGIYILRCDNEGNI
ncbi:MAG: T9SS type A sorting domain-containing protein [Bacteroidota bacterium]|nr:T9SS type A sorting domain-containing protein [Bacteroidota bacterium]